MSRVNPKSMQQRILRLVLSRPETTVSQVAAMISRSMPRTTMISRGRNLAQHDRERRGTVSPMGNNDKLVRRAAVQDAARYLSVLKRAGKISWLRRATYGPPPPKLHVPAEAV